MVEWLTPDLAVVLMLAGVVPAAIIVYLLYPERDNPGVIWFLLGIVSAGVWALTYATFTFIESPRWTLFIANFFWASIPVSAAAWFLLAYEFVFRRVASRVTAVLVFLPIVVFFALTWINPANLIFTDQYFVTPEGYLHFPAFGGPLKVILMQGYGYLLVVFAAGMFVGELLRSTGLQRKQTFYLFLMFVSLVLATIIKVLEFVPMYFDPTPTVLTLTGLLFAYSISRRGSLRFVPAAREQVFEHMQDAILILNDDGVVIDANNAAGSTFEGRLVGRQLPDILPEYDATDTALMADALTLEVNQRTRHFTVRSSSFSFGRGARIHILSLSDMTELREREEELELLRAILSRVLRHDIRNALTVINGYVEMIKTRGGDDVGEYATKIEHKSGDILDQATKARMIDNVIDHGSPVTESLSAIVDQALAVAEIDSSVRIRTTVDDLRVESHPNMHLALQELIENAVTHHDDPGEATIEISAERNESHAALVIEDDGPGISQSEVDVLMSERETDLEHSSGIGLWLVQWIVRRSNGDLTFEVTESGTRITISLPITERPSTAE